MQSDRQGPRGPIPYRRSTGALVALALFVSALALIPVTSHAAPARPLACRELVVNGGFEEGGAGWTQASKLGYALIDTFQPHTGKQGAWLGSKNNAEDSLTQTIALPANASTITLRAWWSVFSEEPFGVAADSATVALLRPAGSVISATLTINNDSAEPWLWNEAVSDISAYAGQTAQLRLRAVTDGSNPSSFFFDDVSILACSDSDTPTATATATPSATPTATATIAPTATRWPRTFLPLLLR